MFISAFGIGKGAVAGASLIGLGSLCYYGFGLSSKPGALEHSQYVSLSRFDTL